VALGACAATGGINAMRNFTPIDEVKRIVYGDQADWYETAEVRPIDAVIRVDYYVRGCPIDKGEFLKVTQALLLGKKPDIPNYPVCVECKMRENTCMFDLETTCLGPVTRAGCDARCPSNGSGCEGCRGLVGDPNTNAHKEVLQKHGLLVEEVLNEFRLFQGCAQAAKE
ncbi:MAG: NADH:ubiquinone oxidoreductase, partial [Candidatus Latescibacterota bacterium]